MEFALWAEMAQMESEKIGERTARGARAAAQRGKIIGDIPFGYQIVAEDPGREGGASGDRRSRQSKGNSVEIDPEAAKLVLRIHRDYDAGKSPYKIAQELTAEGILTPECGRLPHEQGPQPCQWLIRGKCGRASYDYRNESNNSNKILSATLELRRSVSTNMEICHHEQQARRMGAEPTVKFTFPL